MPIFPSNKPFVALTMGDPAGIGPEIILKALAKNYIRALAHFLIIGDASVLRKAAAPLAKKHRIFASRLPSCAVKPYGRPQKIFGKTASKKRATDASYICIADLHNVKMDTFSFGRERTANGKASIEYLFKAVEIIQHKNADCMVTAPINKSAVSKAGFAFPGHTEFLASVSRTKKFIMMLSGGPLKVSLVTRHIPLRNVAKNLSVDAIADAIRLTRQALISDFGIRRPTIGVCGLNPHSGDSGVIGEEEVRIVVPAIKKFASPDIVGPLPADAVFYDAYRGKYDGVVCLYHDQGLIPLKMVARDTGVNITIGLPFVRTSPDHGTAFDIAGKGIADSSSMEEAIKLAVSMVVNRRHHRYAK